ncbi:MAG TPA: HAMP domain-containing sensor histidine kinase [Caldilineaceae bacterium]|nr:HAMP domain-containing sensor histidine kinase [Caldilineaceae bacterium]
MRVEAIEQQITQHLLQRHKLAYAITDQNLTVLEWGGEQRLFPAYLHAYRGLSLYELAPELVGAEEYLAAILAGESAEFQLPYINRGVPGEAVLYVNLTNLPCQGDEYGPPGILHLVEDVTTLGSLEQELVQQRNELSLLNERIAGRNMELAAANAELRQLDQVKSRFISVAAHELRNPLASILGYLEILQEDRAALTADQQQCVNVIQRSSQRLLAITNNLLDLTRIEAGRIELDLQRINLLTLVEHAATELQPRITAKKQTLFLDSAPDLPMAFCDETRSQQILVNLLSNAIKYTPDRGTITVRLKRAADSHFIEVAVSDTGIGIAPEDQDKIFRSFFRASNVHLSGESGTGLGLNVAKSLAELQGGRLWFESKLNQGSTFFATFPIDDIEQEPPSHPERRSERTTKKSVRL